MGFFVEYDTGTETLDTLVGKVAKYGDLASAGITHPVLVLLTSPARETHVHQLLDRHYPCGTPVPLATTTTITRHLPRARNAGTRGSRSGGGRAGMAARPRHLPLPPRRPGPSQRPARLGRRLTTREEDTMPTPTPTAPEPDEPEPDEPEPDGADPEGAAEAGVETPRVERRDRTETSSRRDAASLGAVSPVSPVSPDVSPDAETRAGADADAVAEDAVWQFTQKRPRVGVHTYRGYVRYIDGEYGEKLRGELAEIIAELLAWAGRHGSAEGDYGNRQDAA